MHERLLSVRDAFVALFFVSLGTLIEPEVVRHSLPLLGVMLLFNSSRQVLGLDAGGQAIRLFNPAMRLPSLWGLTQIGELSFVIVQTAMTAGNGAR